MKTKKGVNHFKKSQDEKVKENTRKIEVALSNLPNKIEKVTSLTFFILKIPFIFHFTYYIRH